MERSTVVVRAKVVKCEGRKIFMEASMENEKREVLVEASTLFITMNNATAVVVNSVPAVSLKE